EAGPGWGAARAVARQPVRMGRHRGSSPRPAQTAGVRARINTRPARSGRRGPTRGRPPGLRGEGTMMQPYWRSNNGETSLTIYQGDVLDVLRQLPDESVHCCITSPPYWGLRDYGVDGQIGLEATPQEYVERLVAVFREVRRVLRQDGTLW